MSRSYPRVGAVSYLNSKPLIEGLADALPGGLVLDVPSRLAAKLASDDVDVALVPSIEVLRSQGLYEVVSDACVAARGLVRSVKVYFRVPPGDVRTLALDEGSRTSATLARLMLHHRYGVVPEVATLPLDDGSRAASGIPAARGADAVLLIGDRAMRPAAGDFVAEWDLGDEWNRWTGLPFVFAVWAGRRGCIPEGLGELLCSVRDRGLSDVEAIARREAPRLGLKPELVLEYFTKNLHFTLGSAEQHGLRLFAQLAREAGLAPGEIDLVFRDRTRDDRNGDDQPRPSEINGTAPAGQRRCVGAR